MSALSIQPTYPIFTDIDGQPLEAGYVWIGQANLDPQVNPINVYWDAALTIPAGQPIRTLGGYPVRSGTPSRLYVNSDYSITIKNKNGAQVYSATSCTDRFSSEVISNLAADSVTFIGSGSGATPRTVQSKLREFVSVKDFGAVGDGVTDDLPAILAAIASFPTTLDTTYDSYAGTLYFPPGNYYLSGTLNIQRQIILIGATAPDGNSPGASRLTFADNCNGIVVQEYHTSTTGKGGPGTIIENLAVICKHTSGSVGSGIWLRERATLRHVYVNGFREHGIRIEATSGGISDQGNANNWMIDNARCTGNTLDGLFVNGADANAGVANRLDCSNNGRHGIYDSSFLGNTYIAAHCSGNGAASYLTDSLNAINTFVGCYDESGYTAPSFNQYDVIIGGQLSGSATTGQRLGNLRLSGFRSTKDVTTFAVGDLQNVTNSVFSFASSDEPSFPWRMVYATGRWMWQWANWRDWLRLYNSKSTPANGYARDLSNDGGIGFPRGRYDGDYDQLKYRGLGSAAPVSGTWLQGDIVYALSPTAGGNIGWVCTAGGTPGTWKTFGSIAA